MILQYRHYRIEDFVNRAVYHARDYTYFLWIKHLQFLISISINLYLVVVNVIPPFLSLTALEAVIETTSGATRDNKIGIMVTHCFQCKRLSGYGTLSYCNIFDRIWPSITDTIFIHFSSCQNDTKFVDVPLITSKIRNVKSTVWSQILWRIIDTVMCHWSSGGRLNIKMSSYQYRYPHVKDKTASRPSYLKHGNPHTWERRSLYRDRALVTDIWVAYFARLASSLSERFAWGCTCILCSSSSLAHSSHSISSLVSSLITSICKRKR